MDLLANLVLNIAIPLALGSPPVERAVVNTTSAIAQTMRDVGGGVKSCQDLKIEQNALVRKLKKQYRLPESVDPYVAPKIDQPMDDSDIRALDEDKPATRIIEIQEEYKKRCVS
jgi:hypothetical protein